MAPRPVQLEALAKGYGLPGFAYLMRQRLGKTLTAYAEFCMLREAKEVDWLIVICPNSLKAQWAGEIQKADPLELVCVYNSSDKETEKYFFRKNKRGGVLIINYESINSYTKDLRPPINMSKVYIAADESTKIKRWENKSTKACIALADKCKYKRVLTGRPTANSNLDVWAQLRFIGATTRNYHQHKFTFCLMGGYMAKSVVANQNTDMLKREMEPYCYIAPDKYMEGFKRVYEPLRKVELTPELLKSYKSMEDDLLITISEGVTSTAPIALSKFLRLSQVSSGIAGTEDGEQLNLVEPDRNPRIAALVDLLETECEGKTIIVCRFVLSMKNIQQVLESKGYKVSVLRGGMDARAIEENKRNFCEGDTTILIGQSSVLSYGHNLAASDDSPTINTVFFETTWSLLERAQCEARGEKLGRDVTISYYDFYSSKIDKYMLSTLIRKEDASIALMGYGREFGGRTKESMEVASVDG